MAKTVAVKLTANFEHNLEAIGAFLVEAEAAQAYGALLDELLDTIIPNLERFPDIGRPFLDRPVRSVEVANGAKRLRKKLHGGELREYLLTDYLLLYARYEDLVYLLSIKHHKQLSFDFDHLWDSTNG